MNILVIDDDVDSRESVSTILGMLGHRVAEAESADEGLRVLEQNTINLVLSDIKMPDKTGIDFLRELRRDKENLDFDVVFFTGYATVETAVEALRLGAYDYLHKPVGATELVGIISRVQKRLEIRNKELDHVIESAAKHPAETKYQVYSELEEQLGVFSETMLQKARQALKYHDDRAIPVLIQGETGVGKEVIARLIHQGQEQNRLPFIDINCAAITPSLFESELFGYEQGAFTGSLKRGQIGKFDAASGGTLFLDEVAEIPLELQGKLLRVIQEKEFYRVGGINKIKTDVRIICATNVRLEDAIEAGKFRKDLYYRLKVGTIYIPPLRHRLEEIVPLATRFLLEFSQAKGKKFQGISPKAAQLLTSYSWPGNVRELRNAIEWAVFMHDDIVLKAEHINITDGDTHGQTAVAASQTPEVISASLEEVIDEQTVKLVRSALERCGGNKTLAAQQLGISRRALYRLLEKMNTTVN